MIGATVVGKAAATVRTSEPGLIRLAKLGDIKAENARRFAADPDAVIMTRLTPMVAARRDSNFSVKRPDVSQRSRDESTRYSKSLASRTLPDAGMEDSPGTKTGDPRAPK